MAHFKQRTSMFGAVMPVVLIALKFAPHCYKWPGLVVLYLSCVAAVIIDIHLKPKQIWRLTKRAAICGCKKAVRNVAKVPAMLQGACATCGADVA